LHSKNCSAAKRTRISSALDRWATFLTRAHELTQNTIPERLKGDASILKAIGAVDCMFDEDERQVYEVRMQTMADIKSQIASAEDIGLEKGLEKGKVEVATALLDILDDALSCKKQVYHCPKFTHCGSSNHQLQ